jgi:hypothetical protein
MLVIYPGPCSSTHAKEDEKFVLLWDSARRRRKPDAPESWLWREWYWGGKKREEKSKERRKE